MDIRVCIAFSLLVSVTLLVALLVGIFPKVYKVYEERKLFIDEQFELFDSWHRIPLSQQQRFYFYNVTDDLQLLTPNTPLRMEEVGPFVYGAAEHDALRWNSTDSLNYINFSDMKFLLNYSVASESSALYTLNVALIRDLRENRLGVRFNKSSRYDFRKDIIHKTTVRELLREIIDGFSLTNSPVLRRGKISGKEDEERVSGDKFDYEDYPKYLSSNPKYLSSNPKYLSSNPKSYFQNKLCVELFGIFRIVNAPVYTDGSVASFFEGIPCKCLKFLSNGTEIIQKAFPKGFSLETKLYYLQWDAKACSGIVNSETSFKLKRKSVDGRLFMVSPHTYFGEEDYIEYNGKSKVKSSSEQSHINVEPLSEIITDLTLKYQFNIPIKYINDTVQCHDVHQEVYPVLLTEIIGTSKQQIDYSIFHYIVFPKLFMKGFLPQVIMFTVCVLGIVGFLTFSLIWFSSRRGNARERIPLLDRSMYSYV